MLASEFLRHPQPRSAWRPVDAWCCNGLLHQGIKGAVVAEVGLRPDRLTDGEDLRALDPGFGTLLQ